MNQTIKTPLGIANNNPLNIVHNPKNNWVGLKKSKQRFCVFTHMRWGYRAAAMLLKKYINVYKCNTIRKICERWAPNSENNTPAYIKFVSLATHLDPDVEIKFGDYTVMMQLLAAMTRMENGNEWDPMDVNDLWTAMYEGYIMARENTSDFKHLADATPTT